MSEPMENTDRELWREREGDYYAPSIHVTADGGIGIDVGGSVIVMPLRAWHALASGPAPTPAQDRDRQNGGALRAALGSLDGVLGCIQAMRGRAPQDADTAKIYLRKAIQEIEAAAHPAPVARADGDALRAEVLEEAARLVETWAQDHLTVQPSFTRMAAAIRALATRTNKEPTNG